MIVPKQPGCWLRSSHHLKKALQLTGLNKGSCVENVTGIKPYTEAAGAFLMRGSGAFRKLLKGDP